jgi:hypothetical protein
MEAATPENGWYYDENEHKRARVPRIIERGKPHVSSLPRMEQPDLSRIGFIGMGVPRNEKEIDMKNINERGHEQSRDKIYKCHQVKGRQNIV